jgi:hypothetical protein
MAKKTDFHQDIRAGLTMQQPNKNLSSNDETNSCRKNNAAHAQKWKNEITQAFASRP